jgi:hypothetical protein
MFHFHPERIHDPILRAEAIYWHYVLEAKKVTSRPAYMRHVESEGSDDIAQREAAL